MRYFNALIIIWAINAIFSRKGYDTFNEMILELVIPGILIAIIIAMFTHVFLVKYIKNRFILTVILAILTMVAFKVNENYHWKKFQEEYKEYEQIQDAISTINNTLPIRTTSQTILKDIDVEFPLNKVIYTYLVKGENFIVDEQKFIKSLKQSKSTIIKEICSQDIAKAFFMRRITIEYKYINDEGKQLYSIKLNPKICYD